MVLAMADCQCQIVRLEHTTAYVGRMDGYDKYSPVGP